jgi:hypothetical protein
MTLVALSASASAALDAIIAPSSVVAEQNFPLLYSNQDAAAKYRVYVAATLSDVSGPTCKSILTLLCPTLTSFPGYLINSTSLPDSGLSLSIPADIGPDANYYSIAISVLASNGTSSDAAAISYSQLISITGLTGSYTEYETSLRGAPFWDADLLPCGSYACARKCADEEFPEGTEVGKDGEESYARMVKCFEECDGIIVEPEKGSESTSATGSATGTVSHSTRATTVATTTTSDSAVSASATEEMAVASSSDAAAFQQISGAMVVAGFGAAMAILG